ncbi:hypothetical protein [Haloarcula onubensis]|uniref:Peptidase C-terminal archaeal/bacterial domain-containing protein n=1 Tax=Haloarcula onubensis TaxID=2950539 RepID=A0ABU2FKA1_9EURY|nr:hypothetical protein [Halomicroarcula sp. S3CR25-11]MDS0281176.1 hypothetical protein [Halomicroarcula sp. S3CR25-11]
MATDDSYRTRRRFLTAGASLAAAVALSGCTGGGGSEDDADDEENDENESETTATETETETGPVLDDISGEYTLADGDGTAPTGELAKPLTFQGTSGETVTLLLKSSAVDPVLVLEGPDDGVVAQNDDTPKNTNSRIQTTLEASGEYTVWCGSYFGSTGEFEFTLRRGEPPFSGEGTAEPISYGDSRDLSLEAGDGTDPKYFDLARPLTFRGSSGETVTVEMDSPAFVAHLLLTGPDGSVVSEDGSIFGESAIQQTLSADGQYTIWAGSRDGDATGDFTLSLTEGVQTPSNQSSSNQSSGDPVPISYGQSGTFTLEGGDGTDPDGDLSKPFSFQGSSGDEVVITMTSAEFDTYLLLEGPSGAVVARNDDITLASNTNSRIRTTLGASGEYTVWCGSWLGSETGTFDLSLTLQ